MTDFKIGDSVKLKSGGPKMTVQSLEPKTKDGRVVENSIECIWFVDNDYSEVCSYIFAADTVISV